MYDEFGNKLPSCDPQYRAAVRMDAIDRGLCGVCRKKPHDDGQSTCEGCRTIATERARRNNAKNREEKLAHERAMREIWKSQRICTRCGKRDAANKRKFCQYCLDLTAKYRHNRMERMIASE